MGGAGEIVGMGRGVHQPLGERAPSRGFLHPMSEAWQASIGKMSLPRGAEPLNPCESFLLPQQEDKGDDGEGGDGCSGAGGQRR